MSHRLYIFLDDKNMVFYQDGQRDAWVCALDSIESNGSLLKELRCRGFCVKGCDIWVVLDRRQYVHHIWSFPSQDKSELEDMIQARVRSMPMYIQSEMSWAFDMMPSLREGFSDVSVYLYSSERWQSMMRLLNGMGCFPSVVIPYVSGLRSAIGNYRDLSVCVSRWPCCSEVLVQFPDQWFYSRTAAGKEVDVVLEEARTYIKKFHGRVFSHQPLTHELEQWIDVAIVFRRLSEDSVPNLIPCEDRRAHVSKNMRREYIKLACVMVVLITCFFGWMQKKAIADSMLIRHLNMRIEKDGHYLKEERRWKEKREKYIEGIESVQDRSYWFDGITRALPDDMAISVLSFDGNTFVVEGRAESSGSVHIFQKALQRSDIFTHIVLDYVNQKSSKAEDVYMFRLHGQGRQALKHVQEG